MTIDLAGHDLTTPKGLFIGGEWNPATAGSTISVIDPATGQVLAEVATADETDETDDNAHRAVDAAAGSAPAWAPRRLPACMARLSGAHSRS